jgi:imidazolonepropionase-like amidohydrolase
VYILATDRIVVGDGKEIYLNQALLINEGKIEEIDVLEKLTNQFAGVPVKIFNDCTILPGFIDVHVHLGSLYQRPDANEMSNNLGHITLMAYKHLQDALSVGITSLRGVGEPKGLGEAIRAGYHKGYINGPRYYTCERSITITGGHGSTGAITKVEIDGPWQARQAVRQNIKEGADWIKVMNSHRSHHSEFTLEELKAITDECHRLGKKCCIHAGTEQSIEYAIEAGFDTLEHAAFLTEELANRAISKNIKWVPTAFVYQNAIDQMKKVYRHSTPESRKDIEFLEQTVEGYHKNLLRNYKNGILIATGTDICFPNMFITPIQDEIETLCRFGLSNLQAIECATGNGAKLLDADKSFGFIKKGMEADIIVVFGDPTTDISSLRNIKEVYKSGKLLHSSNNHANHSGGYKLC